ESVDVGMTVFILNIRHEQVHDILQIQQRRLGSSNSKKLVTSRRNVLVLISVFCICFVPYHLVRLLYVVLRGQCSVVLYYLKEVTILISVFNICLDPLIYVFLCKLQGSGEPAADVLHYKRLKSLSLRG
ncbi:hypothetical protein GOODEAATRI_030442, partial [Goodea atripinnis]